MLGSSRFSFREGSGTKCYSICGGMLRLKIVLCMALVASNMIATLDHRKRTFLE